VFFLNNEVTDSDTTAKLVRKVVLETTRRLSLASRPKRDGLPLILFSVFKKVNFVENPNCDHFHANSAKRWRFPQPPRPIK
jgi:hypothetical protein